MVSYSDTFPVAFIRRNCAIRLKISQKKGERDTRHAVTNFPEIGLSALHPCRSRHNVPDLFLPSSKKEMKEKA